jgi:hypothetical protein
MEIAERFGHRVTDLTVSNIEHVASAGVGLALAWIGARRRSLVGALMAVGGIALAVRSATRLYRAVRGDAEYAEYELEEGTEADDVANIQRIRDSSPELYGENQGEGDRRSARTYNDHLRAFIEDDRVDDAARDAADALDGPEAEDLREAEAEGKARGWPLH